MKLLKYLSVLPLAVSLNAQPAPSPAQPAPLTNDTVVASSGDRKITVGFVTKLLETLPPQMRQNYYRDPKGFLSQYMLLDRLVDLAISSKLQDESPYKENIEMARKQVLWQAIIDRTSKTIAVPDEQLKKAYDAKKDSFTQAKVKLVYVPFVAKPAPPKPGDDPKKKERNEADALARAEQVVKQARGTAEFARLVEEFSEDPISKGNSGDFGPIKRGDNLPDAIKQAVFALKANEVSDPIRQANGYYIFKMVELAPQSYEEVKPALTAEYRNEQLKVWMETNAKSVEVKVERDDFFQPPAQQ